MFFLQALCDIGIHHLRLLLILGQLSSAMLLPIWMLLDLRRILGDYEMVSTHHKIGQEEFRLHSAPQSKNAVSAF